MREPLENEYFNWLCAKVTDISSSVYKTLLLILHKTEFVCIVRADQNRAMDGVELRTYFLNEVDEPTDDSWRNLPCSVLEALIAFASRAEFQTDIPASDWFWTFLDNLGLKEYRQVSDADVPVIESILHTLNMRKYDFNGNGGLFPISHTTNDQRKIEWWYQYCEYLKDRGFF